MQPKPPEIVQIRKNSLQIPCEQGNHPRKLTRGLLASETRAPKSPYPALETRLYQRKAGLTRGNSRRNLRAFCMNINGLCGWRRRWDSNPRYAFTHAGFQDRCIRPLCHSSGSVSCLRPASAILKEIPSQAGAASCRRWPRDGFAPGGRSCILTPKRRAGSLTEAAADCAHSVWKRRVARQSRGKT